MMKFDELKKEWLKRPDVKAAYDALAEEFSIAEDDLTQELIARKCHKTCATPTTATMRP